MNTNQRRLFLQRQGRPKIDLMKSAKDRVDARCRQREFLDDTAGFIVMAEPAEVIASLTKRR